MPLRGDPAHTAAEAARLVARLDPVEVLWVSPQPAPKGLLALAPRRLREHLGRAADAVVLDLHEGLDADVLGQAQGFVRGGGRLLLRLPADDSVPLVGQGTLALHPHVPEEVGDHLWRRLLSRLQEGPALGLAEVMEPVSHELSGTLEQDALVDELVAAWTGEARSCRVVLADRGRGKSAGLGRAIARSLAAAPLRVLVTSGQRGQAEELMGFATGGPLSSGGPGSPGARSPGASPLGAGSLRYLPLAELLAAEGPAEAYGSPGAVDLLVVDEAAHLPIPALQALVERHPMAHLAFATTSRGYEGTGRGFVLRFLAWLGEVGRPPGVHSLQTPIRWDLEDPLEALVFEVLALDAEPAALSASTLAEAAPSTVSERAVSGAELAGDELLLRQVFGLLVHAHYRTTPGDLHRLLDAPNLAVHVLEHGGAVVAACLLAREGALSEATCVELAQGRRRLRGHALADTLVTHAGRPAAGQLSMVRSVRIATHPALRRRGLARHLVERVHLTCEADLFGTIFGATPELLRFRRSLGYRLVRVGGSRGERTGAPAAVMLRPACLEAEALVAELQEVLARNLPAQLALMSADGDPSLGVGLAESLMVGLPEATPWTEEALQGELVGYLHGPRTQDAVADALRCWVGAREVLLDDLEPGSRLLVEQRILAGLGWKALTSGAGLPSVPAAQRALRRALRELEALRRAGSP